LLYQRLVRGRQLAQDVVAYAFPIVVGCIDDRSLWAIVRAGIDPKELESALSEEIAALARVTDEDVPARDPPDRGRASFRICSAWMTRGPLSMYTTLFDDPGRINTELDQLRRC